MANVLLIGATGFVGSAVLNELIERGHNVTAVVRNVEKIAKNDLVTAVKEDVANVEAIAKLAEGKDAIISAYNPGWLNPEIATLITENYPKILEAAKQSGVKRIRPSTSSTTAWDGATSPRGTSSSKIADGGITIELGAVARFENTSLMSMRLRASLKKLEIALTVGQKSLSQ